MMVSWQAENRWVAKYFASAMALLVGCVMCGCQTSRRVPPPSGYVPSVTEKATATPDVDHQGTGTAVGAVAGTIAGAVVGHQLGEKGAGALIGAATGAVAGNLIGKHKDQVEAEGQMIQQVHHDAQAMTNFDLVRMAHAGVSDPIIIAAVHDRGGRFDLSPDGIVSLKTSGVSDGVILAVQEASATAFIPPPNPTVVREVHSRAVVVGPRPVIVRPRRCRPRPVLQGNIHF